MGNDLQMNTSSTSPLTPQRQQRTSALKEGTVQAPHESSGGLGGEKVGRGTSASRDECKAAQKEKAQLMADEKERERTERELRRMREQERPEFEREKRKERREEFRKMRDSAASIRPCSQEQLDALKTGFGFEDRLGGMLEKQQDFDFEPGELEGPSQVVTYSSRFVDKLSDITDDMNISGALSIKGGKFGGSGRGAFIDSDKFKQSDLNFYISVKAANQTTNFKDALQFNPVRAVASDSFNAVFGDGFISGFQEGGEFNALVSMRILNTAKKTDVKAEAEVAFTAGPVDISARANVDIAKQNIETNTETTIQASWSGGGQIKPREQQWDVRSLMQAAARFPDLVARRPQRTYAIVTKYETLRSFVRLKPQGHTPLQYENAQIYTNAMMDAYMSYKSLYTRVGGCLLDVQNKTKTIVARADAQAAVPATPDSRRLDCADTAPFAPTTKDLEDARRDMRRQMALIVGEVDAIERDPKQATDFGHVEPFQSPSAVEAASKRLADAPLGGKRIMAKTQTQDEHDQEADQDARAAAMPDLYPSGLQGALSPDEQSELDALKAAKSPGIGEHLQVTAAVGAAEGSAFNNIEFLLPDWAPVSIRAEVREGALAALRIKYDNGLAVLQGGQTDAGRKVELKHFKPGERLVAGSIQTAKALATKAERVVALQLHTNRGRSLLAMAADCSRVGAGQQDHCRDGVVYTDVSTSYFDTPMTAGTLKGFWGRSDDTGLRKLGFVWGDVSRLRRGANEADGDTADPFTAAAIDRSTLARLEREALSFGGRHASWQSDRVQIHYIVWGGSYVWDEGVGRRIREHAESRQRFRLGNDLFAADPWPGVVKSGHIVYRLANAGELRCITRRESEEAAFNDGSQP